MHFLYWIARHTRIYQALSALLVLLLMLLVAWRVNRNIDEDREGPLAEALTTYTSTLESGTSNSRAMGAAILFGLENREAKQLALGKLPADAPEVSTALNTLRKLYLCDLAFLVDQNGMVAAYSSQDNTHSTGLDLSYRPYVKLAMQGVPNVYPAVVSLIDERGIFLAAPVYSGLNTASRTIGTIVLKIGAEKLDALLKSWHGGPAALLSPQGLVFAASREDWRFHITGAIGDERLDRVRHIRQFGQMFDQASPLPLPFVLDAPDATVDGVHYIVRSHALDWDDPEGDWMLLLLDRHNPWWTRWKVLSFGALAGLMASMVLFWLYSLARNAVRQQQLNRDLRIAAATFESQEGVVITNPNQVIVKVNHAFTQITGYSSEEAIGKTPAILRSGRHDAEFFHAMWAGLEREKSWSGEIWNKRKNGEIYPQQLIITSIFGDDGQLVNYVGIFSDITERRQLEDKIRQLAFYDDLTKLPNRRLLSDRLSRAMTASQRNGRYGALMFMDLDNFKPLNDTYGHGAGDLLLIEVGRRIGSCVRATDSVARFGGDEFVVMLSELDTDKAVSAQEARVVAEKIRETLAEPYRLRIDREGQAEIIADFHCTSSIGVALFIDHSASQEDIFKWADMAMYEAKAAGRNSVYFYDNAAS